MNPTQPELLQLFPSPVLIVKYQEDFSEELEYVKNLNFTRTNSHYNKQSEDTFILKNAELSKIRSFIEFQINFFVKEVLSVKENLIITQSWINRNSKGQSHHEHVHPNSIISGVFYFQVNEQLPPIKFKNDKGRDFSLTPINNNNFNSATFYLPINAGELIIFPSSLSHSVPKNNLEEERISLSFNTFAKDSLGDINTLTYLPLKECSK